MSEREDGKVSKGGMVMFTSGEYSDFGNLLFAEALCDLDMRALVLEWNALPKDARWSKEDRFMHWLTHEKKAIKETEWQEWWLGSYGPDIDVPGTN